MNAGPHQASEKAPDGRRPPHFPKPNGSGVLAEYRLGFAFVGPVALLIVWQVAHSSRLLDPTLLPSPASALGQMIRLVFGGSVLGDLWMTFLRTAGGFALAAIVGIALGLAMGAYRPVYYSAVTVVDFFRSVPVTALYPLFVLLLGISHASKIGMVFTACVFVIALNSAYGVLRSNPIRLQMASLYGASRLQMFRWVVFHDALPHTMVGLRVAISYALIVEVLCEMFMGSQLGLGQRIMEAYTTYAIDQMYALILITGLCGFGLNRLFVVLEKLVVPWSGR